jgi:hypothetical protein
MNNIFSSNKLNKKKTLKAGLLGLVTAASLSITKPGGAGEVGVFTDLSQSPAQTALQHNNTEAKNHKPTPLKFAGEFYLDRMVNNNLNNIYTEAQLKSVATKQAVATKKFLIENKGEFTVDNFNALDFNNELAISLSDIERNTLGDTIYSDHTQEFFGNKNRQQAQDQLQQNSINNNWKQSSKQFSDYNFDARGIFADMEDETSTKTSQKKNIKSEQNKAPKQQIDTKVELKPAGSINSENINKLDKTITQDNIKLDNQIKEKNNPFGFFTVVGVLGLLTSPIFINKGKSQGRQRNSVSWNNLIKSRISSLFSKKQPTNKRDDTKQTITQTVTLQQPNNQLTQTPQVIVPLHTSPTPQSQPQPTPTNLNPSTSQPSTSMTSQFNSIPNNPPRHNNKKSVVNTPVTFTNSIVQPKNTDTSATAHLIPLTEDERKALLTPVTKEVNSNVLTGTVHQDNLLQAVANLTDKDATEYNAKLMARKDRLDNYKALKSQKQAQAALSVEALLQKHIATAGKSGVADLNVTTTPDTNLNQPQQPVFTEEQIVLQRQYPALSEEDKDKTIDLFIDKLYTRTGQFSISSLSGNRAPESTGETVEQEDIERIVDRLKQAKELYFGDLGIGKQGKLDNNIRELLLAEVIEITPEDYEIINDKDIKSILHIVSDFDIMSKEILAGVEARDIDLVKNEFESEYFNIDKQEKLEKLAIKYPITVDFKVENTTESIDKVLNIMRQLHEIQNQAYSRIRYVPSDRKLFYCGDIINDRNDSDVHILTFFKSIRAQAEAYNLLDPFTITASNHDIGILNILYPGEDHSTTSPHYASSLFPKVLGIAPSEEEYRDYLLKTKLFDYDPTTQRFLAHCMLSNDEDGKTIKRLQYASQKFIGKDAPTNTTEMVEFVEKFNNWYHEAILEVFDPERRSPDAKIGAVAKYVDNRGFGIDKESDLPFQGCIKSYLHGHHKTGGYLYVDSKRFDPSSEFACYDLQDVTVLN